MKKRKLLLKMNEHFVAAMEAAISAGPVAG